MSVAAVTPAGNGTAPLRAPSLETIGMTKIFGSLVALDDVSIKVEPGTVHALAIVDGAPAGAARFYAAEPRVAQIGRMAVLREARGRGLGRALLEALLAEAWARGYGRVRLLAQLHAVPFYARFGFAALPGPEILDGGILHRTMELRRSTGDPPLPSRL